MNEMTSELAVDWRVSSHWLIIKPGLDIDNTDCADLLGALALVVLTSASDWPLPGSWTSHWPHPDLIF